MRKDAVWTMCVFTRLAPADAGAMYQSGAQSCLGEDARSGAFVARAARFMLHAQLRQGRYVR